MSVVVPYFRSAFAGALMMDVSWENPGMQPKPGLTFGIDAYRPLNLSDSASVASLTTGWSGWLKRLTLPVPLKDIYIIEVGIAAQSHAYTHPSLHD
jgi:hypothetical protein